MQSNKSVHLSYFTRTYLTYLYLELLDYMYAGMQHADECYCGASGNATRHGKVGDEECNYSCSGNAEEMCGGFLRSSVWMHGNFTISPLANKHIVININVRKVS